MAMQGSIVRSVSLLGRRHLSASQSDHFNPGGNVDVALGLKEENNPCLRRESSSESPVTLTRNLEVNIKLDGTETREAICALRSTGARLCNHCCRGKAISSTNSDCVFVSLCIRHAMRMRRIILSSLAFPAVPYFSILFHEWHDTGKNYRS
jgi:hypothetical protein